MSEVVDKAMDTTEAKTNKIVSYRRPLNAEQIRTLHALYWFRFCTSKQLALFLKKPNHKAIQDKLKILEDQAFISKRYEKSYKLAGRPAEYYITPAGARALEKAKPGVTNPWANKSLYKNKTVSDDFLKHCITVTDVNLRLGALYGDKLQRFTKSYMAAYNNYPEWTPDTYLRLDAKSDTGAKHYFLDIWDGTKPFFVTVRKTRNYVNFKESGDWNEDTFPAILAICEDVYTQKKLNRQMKRILNDAWDDELIFATTTKQQLKTAVKPTERIWLKIAWDGENEKRSLRSLFVTS